MRENIRDFNCVSNTVCTMPLQPSGCTSVLHYRSDPAQNTSWLYPVRYPSVELMDVEILPIKKIVKNINDRQGIITFKTEGSNRNTGYKMPQDMFRKKPCVKKKLHGYSLWYFFHVGCPQTNLRDVEKGGGEFLKIHIESLLRTHKMPNVNS